MAGKGGKLALIVRRRLANGCSFSASGKRRDARL